MATKNTKKQPSGYWYNYENNYNEAQKYNSRNEFKKGCGSAYDAARKNGWLDKYTWFTEKPKYGYWNYETCYQEAQKYKSRKEFAKGCGGAYDVARKNGWLDDYSWFISRYELKTKWTEKTCYQESQKYKSRSEFAKGCGGAYDVARKNGWLDKYTWFISTNELKKINQTKWTYETCYQEAKKYKSRSKFNKSCHGAYDVARKNGWLDDYTWFEKDLNPYNRYNVYCYIFTELHSIYVGITIDINRRNNEHNNINEKSTVYKFAKQNNIPIPQITILETNLNPLEGQEKEDFYVNKYKQEGWNVLNIAKTGKNCGSLGTLNNGKWTEKTCYQEAQKYKSRTEFAKGCHGAYDVARKNGWLDDYSWFISTNELLTKGSKLKTKWTKKTCRQEAQKYKSRSEFAKGCSRAYEVARKNGWLDKYTWFEKKLQPNGYWNDYNNNYQEAQKYKSRSEFNKGCSRAYEVARENGWLDKYTWFIEKKKPSGYWTYKTCYQEAQKYKSRKEFEKGCGSAYKVALKNSWLDDYFPNGIRLGICI